MRADTFIISCVVGNHM